MESLGTTREKDVVRTENGTHTVEKIHSQAYEPSHSEQKLARLERIKRVGGLLITVISVILSFRFVLLLLGANPNNGFANFIYQVSQPLAAPFVTLFGSNPTLGQSVFELPTLIAIAVYALLGYGTIAFMKAIAAPEDPSGRAYE